MEGPALIEGVHIVSAKRVGKPVRHYVYAWRGGPLIHTKIGGEKPKLGPEAVEKYNAAVIEHRRAPGGTFGRLIDDWRASPEWEKLAASTKAEWGRALDELPAKWRIAPLGVFNHFGMKDKIAAWRDAYRETPRKADYLVQVLRALLAWGVSRGRLKLNVAEGLPPLWSGGEHADVIWEPAERQAMLATPQQVSDAFRLACLTGLRRGDLVALPDDAAGPHAIVWRPSKSKRSKRVVTIPMIPPLRALIEELRTRKRKDGVKTLLVNSRGKSWTADGLESSFIKERDKVACSKRLHDARGTFVTELCLAGLTDETIAGIVGWGVTAVAKLRRIYVDQARVVVEIGEAMARREKNSSGTDL